MTRKQVADHLNWPQTRIELIETGRIKVDHHLVSTLVATYGVRLDHLRRITIQWTRSNPRRGSPSAETRRLTEYSW